MSIEAAFLQTISFISYGEIIFDLHVFYLHAYFQERNYRVNQEVAAYRLRHTHGTAEDGLDLFPDRCMRVL
jgi:hypothetical protein